MFIETSQWVVSLIHMQTALDVFILHSFLFIRNKNLGKVTWCLQEKSVAYILDFSMFECMCVQVQ